MVKREAFISQLRHRASTHKGRHGSGSVWLRFLHGTVRAVPVFGSDGSSLESVFSVTALVYCFNRKGWFQFRFLTNGSDGSGSSAGFWSNGSDVPVSCSGSVPGPSLCLGVNPGLPSFLLDFLVLSLR